MEGKQKNTSESVPRAESIPQSRGRPGEPARTRSESCEGAEKCRPGSALVYVAPLHKIHPDVSNNWRVLMKDLGAKTHLHKLHFPPANDKILRPGTF